MTQQTDILNQKPPSNNQQKKDPRNIVTPDAFTVADDMLGLPLASPKRRAAAMGLDMLLIQQISQIGSLGLGLSMVVVLFLLSRSEGRKTVGTLRRTVFNVMAITLFISLVAMQSWQHFQTQDSSKDMLPSVTEEIINDNPTTYDLPVAEQLNQIQQELLELKQENAVLRADDNSNIIDIFEAMARKFGYGFGWAGVYFTLFVFLLRGQTPGKWLFRIRIVQLDGKKLTMWNSFGRYGGYAASVVTGLTGFLQIYWDANRQGLHDKVASTVVVRV